MQTMGYSNVSVLAHPLYQMYYTTCTNARYGYETVYVWRGSDEEIHGSSRSAVQFLYKPKIPLKSKVY